jgi:hypothetical protein
MFLPMSPLSQSDERQTCSASWRSAMTRTGEKADSINCASGPKGLVTRSAKRSLW